MKDKKKWVERFYKRLMLKEFIILHSFIKIPVKGLFFKLRSFISIMGSRYLAVVEKSVKRAPKRLLLLLILEPP